MFEACNTVFDFSNDNSYYLNEKDIKRQMLKKVIEIFNGNNKMQM